MKFVFLIQARLGSSRLPGKILLPFSGSDSILDLLVKKLKHVDADIILATSDNKQNDKLEGFSDQYGINCFRGSENDVLQRFIDAAEKYGADNIIRVCSDNPFLDLNSIKQLIRYVEENKKCFDYVSFNIQGTPSIKTHYGFWTEYVTLDALKRVKTLTNEPLYHEHVTNYIYSHLSDFAVSWIDGPECLQGHSDIRLTIDTEEDFKNAAKIYSDLCLAGAYPTISDVVNYLDNHPEYYEYMHNQILKNSK